MPKEVDKLNNRGIFTISQLSYTFRPRKARKRAAQPARPQYPLKALALRDKKTYILDPPTFPHRQTEIFIDFEGLPDERYVYLIGMILRRDGIETRQSFWADTQAESDELMFRFLNALQDAGDFTLYHYGSFEARAASPFQTPRGRLVKGC